MPLQPALAWAGVVEAGVVEAGVVEAGGAAEYALVRELQSGLAENVAGAVAPEAESASSTPLMVPT